MRVDKNLFPYDLAIVSIMKNAARYVKEWLDYHLLAGVNHFFIYDNESEDNFKEILQPYIDAGLVTYIFYPGKRRLMESYNDAIRNFKFFCRYMTFVDDDEFILPRGNRKISDVVDEVLSLHPDVEGVEMAWVCYGSSGHKTADYSRGVLERFTHRVKNFPEATKTIVNPRRVSHMWSPHFAIYFQGCLGVRGKDLDASPGVDFTLHDRIVMNHYHTKSLEEYIKRKSGTDAGFGDAWKNIEKIFEETDSTSNEVFDDEILRYRAARQRELVPNGDVVKTFAERNEIDFEKIFSALRDNLSTVNGSNRDFFQGKLENFMTCLNLSGFLKETFIDEKLGADFEKISLIAIVKTLQAGATVTDMQFLVAEMPNLLALPYPEVHTIRKICADMIIEWRNSLRDLITGSGQLKIWEEIFRWDNQLRMLEAFDNYNHK